MASSGRLLLDPDGHLRSESSTLEDAGFQQHATVESLLGQLRRQSATSLLVVDACTLSDDQASKLRERDDRQVVLMLVAVSSFEDGVEWLRHGAHDFAVLPERRKELDDRVRGAVRLHDALLDPRYSNEAQFAYLRSLVHDLKNPLNAIIGYAELLLLEESLDESADADLRRVLENASLLQSILDAVPQSAEAIEEGSGPTLEATEVS